MQKYIKFNEYGSIKGIYLDDICPIPENEDYVLVTAELANEIANYEVTTVQRADIPTDKINIYSRLEDVIKIKPAPPPGEVGKTETEKLELRVTALEDAILSLMDLGVM